MNLYRKKVRHKAPRNYQLDLFDPVHGYYEYSAIATNMTLDGRRLWRFMCGQGELKKTPGNSRAAGRWTRSRRITTRPTVPGSKL